MDPSSAPLADYFWIAGVDSSSYGNEASVSGSNGEGNINSLGSGPVESTIEEDQDLESEESKRSGITPASTTLARGDSFHRLSKLSDEVTKLSIDARRSIQSVTSDKSIPSSNRSSVTIRAALSNGTSSVLSDVDFDKALLKFASERDNFLDELTFSAGTIVPKQPARHSKAQRIVHDEIGGVKSGSGSIRRHMSFRDLNSMKRQPSVARTGQQSPDTVHPAFNANFLNLLMGGPLYQTT